MGLPQDVIMSAIGGMRITETVEGLERYPVNLRYPRDLRDNPDQLSRVLVPTPFGAQIPLGLPILCNVSLRRRALINCGLLTLRMVRPASGGVWMTLPGPEHVWNARR